MYLIDFWWIRFVVFVDGVFDDRINQIPLADFQSFHGSHSLCAAVCTYFNHYENKNPVNWTTISTTDYWYSIWGRGLQYYGLLIAQTIESHRCHKTVQQERFDQIRTGVCIENWYPDDRKDFTNIKWQLKD